MRYLVRLANSQGRTPKDAKALQSKIRELLGSADKMGNLRVSTTAIEFDLFADQAELSRSKNILETRVSNVMTLRPIESSVAVRGADETLREGIDLFNQERFWEAHEILEEIWHPATGVEREVIQGLILTAAAFVHYQKNEMAVCVSILGRALEKLGTIEDFRDLDIKRLRTDIRGVLEDNLPNLFRIGWIEARPAEKAR